MTQTISPQIRCIPDPDTASAIFFFGFPANQFPRELIEIHGVSPTPGGSHYRHAGRVLGGEPGSPIALVVRAGPGTLIEMTALEWTSNIAFPFRLEVGNDLRTAPALTRRSPPVLPSIAMNLPSSRDHNSTLTLADDDLLGAFADTTLPTWLREVLDSQLVFWNKHHAKLTISLLRGP